MDWNDLRLVLELHRAGSMTGAAKALGVARTTVGRQLADTETRWGARLFDRTPDGLVATPVGEELVETAARVEDDILTTAGRLHGRDAELRGALRVSTVDFVFDCWPDLFATFTDRFPGVDLTVGVGDAFASLARRDADVVLRMANAPGDILVGRKVRRIHFDVYAARTLVERIGADAPLSAYPWIDFDARQDARWLDRFLAEYVPDAEIALRASDYRVRRRAVLAGFGVHHLPVPDGERLHELVSLGGRAMSESRDLWVLTLPDLRHNRRIRAFMDHVVTTLRAPTSGSASSPVRETT